MVFVPIRDIFLMFTNKNYFIHNLQLKCSLLCISLKCIIVITKKTCLILSISINNDRHIFQKNAHGQTLTRKDWIKRCHRNWNFKALVITITKRLLNYVGQLDLCFGSMNDNRVIGDIAKTGDKLALCSCF